MRPLYETAEDRSKERQIIDMVAQRTGMKAVKLPKFDVDFVLMKGEVVWGVAEVKGRMKHYPQMFVGLEKIQKLRQYACTGLQARMIFATPEGIFAKKIGPAEVDGWIGVGGRKDRGDSLDIELLCYFDTSAPSEEKNVMTRVCDSDPRWFQ